SAPGIWQTLLAARPGKRLPDDGKRAQHAHYYEPFCRSPAHRICEKIRRRIDRGSDRWRFVSVPREFILRPGEDKRDPHGVCHGARSEERRVGKECRGGWSAGAGREKWWLKQVDLQ